MVPFSSQVLDLKLFQIGHDVAVSFAEWIFVISLFMLISQIFIQFTSNTFFFRGTTRHYLLMTNKVAEKNSYHKAIVNYEL